MTKDEAIKKLEETVGAYLLSGRADGTRCGEWREILETLKRDNTCTVAEYDRDHIWYKGRQYISLNRFIEIAREQKPCKDAISRAEANKLVDELARAIDDKNRHYPKRGRDIAIIARDIERLPSVTPIQKWIPVSEKPPEELTPVNITWVNRNPEPYYNDIKDKPFSATGVYYKGEWYWYSSTCEDYLAEYGRCEWNKIDASIEVTAWMPLPEPYKSEVSE